MPSLLSAQSEPLLISSTLDCDMRVMIRGMDAGCGNVEQTQQIVIPANGEVYFEEFSQAPWDGPNGTDVEQWGLVFVYSPTCGLGGPMGPPVPLEDCPTISFENAVYVGPECAYQVQNGCGGFELNCCGPLVIRAEWEDNGDFVQVRIQAGQ